MDKCRVVEATTNKIWLSILDRHVKVTMLKYEDTPGSPEKMEINQSQSFGV